MILYVSYLGLNANPFLTDAQTFWAHLRIWFIQCYFVMKSVMSLGMGKKVVVAYLNK